MVHQKDHSERMPNSEKAIELVDVPSSSATLERNPSWSGSCVGNPDLLDPERGDGQGSSVLGASFNFMNSIVGAGIIGLPFAFKHTGVFMGVLLLYLVAVIVQYGVIGLIQRGARIHRFSYEELCEKSFGVRGFYVVSLFMFLLAFGAMIAYIIVIGDNVPKVFSQIDENSFLADRSTVILLFSSICILPLCLLKDMSSLSKTSVLSILSVIVIVLTVAIRGPTVAKEEGIRASDESHPYAFARSELFAGLGAMSFAFVCHHNSFLVYNSLKKRTPENWRLVTRISIWTSFALSVLMALMGYLSFFSLTKGDILNNFAPDDSAINFSRILLSFTMVFTYPMEQFVARHCMLTLVYGDNFTNVHFYTVTVMLWGVSVIIGLVLDDLGVVLEVTGALTASMLGYIIPAVVFFIEADVTLTKQFWDMVNVWRQQSDVFSTSLRERMNYFTRFWAPFSMFLFGLFAMVYGTISAGLSASP